MIQAEVKEKLSVQQAVLVLKEYGVHVTVNAIYQWCWRGKLKKARLVGGRWYIDEEEIRAMAR